MNLFDSAQEAVSGIAFGEFGWCHSKAATPTVLLDVLPSTARAGSLSRLVPTLERGAGGMLATYWA